MKNHRFKFLSSCFVLAVLGLLFACFTDRTQGAEERMNILFILTDDQRDNTFSGMGHPWIQTPHVDELLTRSTRFSNAYIAEPICRPSRASLLLGCHERVHRIGFSSSRKLTRKQWQGSYPVMLKAAGYHTGLVGKWHINQEKGLELDDLFDVFEGHNGHGKFLFDSKDESGNTIQVTTNQKKTDDALLFIDQAPKDKPFCLSLCYATPHSSKFRLMWRQFAEPAFNNPDLTQHPMYGKSGPYRDLSITTPLASNPNPYDYIPRHVIDHDKGRNSTYNFCYQPDMCYELHMRYHQMVTELDQVMGQLISGLKERNLTEKTLIIFGSDHGLLMGDYGMGGKGLLYDLASKFPCFIYDPTAPET
ncbi:MAG: sulfatase-like hydrolase/transferase, partial [Verrucomicrobiota bacterium]